MGLHDAEEMLDAAKQQAILDEREIGRLRAELRAAEEMIVQQVRQLTEQAGILFHAGEEHGILWRERHQLEQQLDAVRRLCTAEAAPYDGVEAWRVLEIIGTQPAISGDEHERSA